MPGLSAIAHKLAAAIVARRGLVIALALVFAGLAAFSLRWLELDPAPERLVASVTTKSALIQRAEEKFKLNEPVLVVMVRGKAVLKTPNLHALHTLTQRLDQASWTARAMSITNTPFPREGKPTPSEDTLNDLDDLDDLEGDDSGDLDEITLAALLDLVEAHPDLFPDGLEGLGTRIQSELNFSAIGDESSGKRQATWSDAQTTELDQALAASKLFDGRLINKKRDMLLVAVFPKATDYDGVAAAHDKLLSEVERFQKEAPDLSVELTGLAHIRTTITKNLRKDNALLVPLTLLICMCLLYLSFRWWPAVFLPIVAVALTALMTIGGMAVVGEPLNVLNNIMPALLIIIGVSDSIHLIDRYLEEKRTHKALTGQSEPPTEHGALKKTVRAMLVACLLTSLTTAIGLFSLVVARSTMLSRFGVAAAAGVMLAYVVTIAFVPATLSYFKRPTHVDKTLATLTKPLWIATHTALKHPKMALMLSLVTAGSLFYVGWAHLVVDHRLLDQFTKDDPIRLGTEALEDNFMGFRPLHIIFGDPKHYDTAVSADLATLERKLRKDRAVITTQSPATVVEDFLSMLSAQKHEPSAYRAKTDQELSSIFHLLSKEASSPIARFISRDKKEYRLTIFMRAFGAQETVNFIEALEKDLKTMPSLKRTEFGFSGDAYSGSVGLDAVVRDLSSSLITATLIIFVVVSLLFRSLRYGLLSMPPNIFPLILTLAYLVMRGYPLNAANIIIFSISLGLSVDGSIHLLTRYRALRTEEGLNVEAALRRAVTGTGRAIVITCAVLSIGFSALLLSNFMPVRHFGELIAVSALGCVVAALFIQPAVIRVFDKDGP